MMDNPKIQIVTAVQDCDAPALSVRLWLARSDLLTCDNGTDFGKSRHFAQICRVVGSDIRTSALWASRPLNAVNHARGPELCLMLHNRSSARPSCATMHRRCSL